MGFFAPEFILFDGFARRHRLVDKTQFAIGSGADCDWRIDDPASPVEIPTLWVLSRVAPAMVPSIDEG